MTTQQGPEIPETTDTLNVFDDQPTFAPDYCVLRLLICWETAKEGHYQIADMERGHVVNAYRMCIRRAEEYAKTGLEDFRSYNGVPWSTWADLFLQELRFRDEVKQKALQLNDEINGIVVKRVQALLNGLGTIDPSSFPTGTF